MEFKGDFGARQIFQFLDVQTLQTARHLAIAVTIDHRQNALDQIAEIVGEVAVDAVDNRLVRKVAVITERYLTQ